ncbi:MAG: CubicO group peptidase (beta-lactamase class C family), partial [Colwellia sp.]
MYFKRKNIGHVVLLASSLFSIGCSAQSKQTVYPASSTLAANINKLLSSENLPGLVIQVRKNNKIIHHQAYGYADLEAQTPMTKDNLFRLNSMTKPVTALITLQVLAEKDITLDSPLQTVFPQFEQQSDIPLSSVMTHTSGFSYGFHPKYWAGWQYLFSGIGGSQSLTEFVNILADIPLLTEPGEKFLYSFSSDVQGAVVEKLTGKKLSDNMNTRLFSKLGMTDTSFYVEPERVNRLAPMYGDSWFGDTPTKKEDDSVTQAQGAESGGSGLVSTAADYSNFVQLLMTPESYPDIVHAEHVALMTTNQLPKDIPTIPDRMYTNSGYSYGMGVKLKDEQYLSEGSFYWAGNGGTIFWADPK